MANQLAIFLGELIRRPTQVVALAPSSVALSEEMAAQVSQGDGAVVELGPLNYELEHEIPSVSCSTVRLYHGAVPGR